MEPAWGQKGRFLVHAASTETERTFSRACSQHGDRKDFFSCMQPARGQKGRFLVHVASTWVRDLQHDDRSDMFWSHAWELWKLPNQSVDNTCTNLGSLCHSSSEFSQCFLSPCAPYHTTCCSTWRNWHDCLCMWPATNRCCRLAAGKKNITFCAHVHSGFK